MVELSLIQQICIWAIPVLFAITIHEVAHGWIASLCGDQTARLSGRLTINPINHVDLMGTVIVPIVLFVLTKGNFIFGWAKPVPVDGRNLRNPKRDMALVAVAGPFVNILMAIGWALLTKLGLFFLNQKILWLGVPLVYMGEAGVMINVVLAVLNFLPIPPLDGSRILASVLPGRMAWQMTRLEPYGFFILVVLIFTGVLSSIISPPIEWLAAVIMRLFG